MHRMMIDNKIHKKSVIIGALIVLSLVFLFVLPLGHDLRFHIWRIGTMASELQKNPGQLPIRMLSDSYNGYGYGAALYYGDLFLYIPALLVCVGVDEVWAYKIFIILILWGTFGIAYYSARIMKKEKEIALFFSTFYTFSSYSLQNLYVRSAIGEALAFMFLPLVIAAFCNILYEDKRMWNWFLLGGAMSAIAMSHILTLVLVTIVLIIWCILEIKKVIVEKKVIEIFKAAGFMIGISASFLFPMFEQMLHQKVQVNGNSDYERQRFLAHTIDSIDYFIPYEMKKIWASLYTNEWNVEVWHPGAVGLFVFIIVGAVLALKPKLNKKQIGIVVCSMGGLIVLSIYRVTNMLREFFIFIQYPWRLLMLITLGFSFSGIMVLNNVECGEKRRRNVEWCMLIGTLLIAIWSIGPRIYTYIQESNVSSYEKDMIIYDKNAGDDLYLPTGVARDFYMERGETIVASNKGIEFEWQRTQNGINIHIIENLFENGSLELPLYMYKGYAAMTTDGEYLPIVKSENGLVSVEIGNSIGDIKVWYQGTLVQKISDLITLITIISLLCGYRIIIYKLRRKKETI